MYKFSALQIESLNADYDKLQKANSKLQKACDSLEDEKLFLQNELDRMAKDAEIRYVQGMWILEWNSHFMYWYVSIYDFYVWCTETLEITLVSSYMLSSRLVTVISHWSEVLDAVCHNWWPWNAYTGIDVIKKGIHQFLFKSFHEEEQTDGLLYIAHTLELKLCNESVSYKHDTAIYHNPLIHSFTADSKNLTSLIDQYLSNMFLQKFFLWSAPLGRRCVCNPSV